MKKAVLVLSLLALVEPCLAQAPHLGNDVYLFDGPALKAARAVKWQRRSRLRGLVKRQPALLAYREPTYGMTLLYWAVRNGKRRALNELLTLGADPNVLETYSGKSPLIEAAGNDKASDYLRALLAHGANPNMVARPGPQMLDASPLMAAAENRLESVRLLLAAGADLNFISQAGMTAAGVALIRRKADVAYFLVVEQKADVSQFILQRVDGTGLSAAAALRSWTFPLDSPEYQTKMLLVAYLKAQGQDYRKTPIPERFYKMYSKEYLSSY